METKWYKIVRAQVITYTDTKTGIIHTKNIVSFYGGMHKEFDYVEDGGKAILLKEGDHVSFIDNNISNKILSYR